jgi:hypothetical protein
MQTDSLQGTFLQLRCQHTDIWYTGLVSIHENIRRTPPWYSCRWKDDIKINPYVTWCKDVNCQNLVHERARKGTVEDTILDIRFTQRMIILSGQIFFDCLTIDDGTDRLSQNVANQTPAYNVQHPWRAKMTRQMTRQMIRQMTSSFFLCY